MSRPKSPLNSPTAERDFRECLELFQKQKAPELNLADSRASLAAALVAQKKYADAEPPFLAAFDAYRLQQATLPSVGVARWLELHATVVKFYLVWGKTDEANRWRARWSELPPEAASPPRPLSR